MANSTADKPLPAAALPFVVGGLVAFSFMYLTLALTFAVLRVVVTERDVLVKYGLWGPTIPLRSVTSCRIVDYDWKRYGGWGIRRGVDGSWAYVASGGKVVELCFRDGDADKKVLVGAEDPEELARQIQRARTALTGPRVAVGAGVEAEAADVAAEREAEAAAEAAAEDERQRERPRA
jgi:hypothetical protein